jgi:hypothetical protein
VPPHDGDRPPSESEDGLVAQIIPLRHRQRDAGATPSPRTLMLHAEDAPRPDADDVSLGERSVWDPPTGELRRRGTQPGAAPSPTVRADRVSTLVSRFSWRVVAAAATVALGGALLALVLSSAFSGPAGSATRQASVSTRRASSSANARVIANRLLAPGSRPASNAAGGHHQQQPGGRPHRHSRPPSSSAAYGTSLASDMPDSTTPTSSGPASTTASSASESPPTSSPGESASAPAAPSAGARSTPQSQCVPGELGC